jgi:hypothetical protein
MRVFAYDREKAVSYARLWAFDRNPLYFDFDNLGGDCTNFVSQCIFAGCGVMNYTKTFGWFYNSINSRAPAWTGVDEFHSFIVNNQGFGPFAKEINSLSALSVGDVVQLFSNGRFYHTVIVTGIYGGEIYTSSHTRDTYNKRLSSYPFEQTRLLKIQGYRK